MYWLVPTAVKFKDQRITKIDSDDGGQDQEPVVLPPQPEANTRDLHEITAMFYRRRRIIAATFTLIIALGMLYTHTRRPIYESSARVVVVTSRPRTVGSENDIPIVKDLQALRGDRTVDTVVEVISSPDLLNEAFESMDAGMRGEGFGSRKIPGWSYQVLAKKNTDVIEITGRAYTPAASAGLANTIAETFFKRDLNRNSLATRKAREYAENEVTAAGRELSRANAELSKYKQATGLFAADTQLTKAAEQISQLSQELQFAREQLAASQQETEVLRRELARQKQDVVANTTVSRNPQFTAILDKIDSMNSERTSLLQEFTPESREVRAVEERIRQEQARLENIAETIVGSTLQARNPVRDTLLASYAGSLSSVESNKARIKSLEAEFNARKLAVKDLPEQEKGLTEREQRVALLQRRYEMLSNNYYTLLLSEQAVLPSGTMVSAAGAPLEPKYPSHTRNLILFLLFGTAAAVVATMIAEFYDSRLHDQKEIEYMSGMTILSVIPEVSHDSPRLSASSELSGPLLESFRILRNNLTLSDPDQQLKIVAVTSPGRGEGKSTTIMNLAITLAMEGKRVLLVDGDVRRPSLHRYLVVPRHIGLTSVLNGEYELEKAIVRTSMKGIDCLPSGPACPNCTEMLNQPAGRQLFKRMSEMYEVVLIDCPPATGLSDVQIISTIADGVLLVVSMNQTLRQQLDMTMNMLSHVGAPLTGVVLNRMDVNHGSYKYYYYSDDEYNSEPDDVDYEEILARSDNNGGG